MHLDNKLEKLRIEEIAHSMTLYKSLETKSFSFYFLFTFFPSVQETGEAKKYEVTRVITKN